MPAGDLFRCERGACGTSLDEEVDTMALSITSPFVAAILDEKLPPEVTLFELAVGTPVLWEEQRGRFEGDR
jgi:hypothetical protein